MRRYKRLISYIIVFVLGFLIAISLNFDFSDINVINMKDSGTKGSSSAYVVAVSSLENKGVIGKVTIDIYEGDGKVLIDTNPFLEPDTQYSANMAVQLAKLISNERLDDKNIIFDFDIEGNVLG